MGGETISVMMTDSGSHFPPQREQAMEQKWEQLLWQDRSKLDSSEDDEDYREAVLTPEHR